MSSSSPNYTLSSRGLLIIVEISGIYTPVGIGRFAYVYETFFFWYQTLLIPLVRLNNVYLLLCFNVISITF